MIADLLSQLESDLTGFYTIAHGYSAKAIETIRDNYPSVLISPGAETAMSNTADNFVTHRVTRMVEVFLVTELADLDTNRDAVFDSILGYQSTNTDYSQLEYVSGSPLEIEGTAVIWQDLFQYTYSRRQT